MRQTIIGAGCFVFALCTTLGQTPVARPTFEVASVHPLDPNSGAPGTNVMRGGPGTGDPTQITFISVTMQRLLMTAYGVGAEQISGPGWLDGERYAIAAKIPLGATREQLLLMLQNLLAERFHLALHHAAKNFPMYELVVAKGGSKLKPSEDASLRSRYVTGADNGISRLTFSTFSLADFAGVLGIPLGTMYGNFSAAHVVDNTGLTGKYDFTLEFAGYMGPGGALPTTPDGPAESGPSLFTALETQLGLKLNDKKASIDVLMIDHVDKVPTAN
jgi:uncharacterized protein (TIGR03435 family)